VVHLPRALYSKWFPGSVADLIARQIAVIAANSAAKLGANHVPRGVSRACPA
jgi:hypothetical protein